MVNNPSVNVTATLKQSQVDQIVEFQKKHKKRYPSNASAFQHIVDNFFKGGKRKNITFLLYPFIIMILMLYAGISTVNLNSILIEQGLYFNELYIQQQIFYIIGFLFLSITIASFLWFFYVKRE